MRDEVHELYELSTVIPRPRPCTHLTRPDDDGIVALEDAMSERRSVHDYLAGREEMRPMELVWGVCEPAAAAFFD